MNKTYITTVGLEIHAELRTKSKMWCACANAPHAGSPNTNICEVCTAQPGTLPVANLEAIKKVIQVGLAVNGDIADFTEFDRKNYFYPDIPKAYQLSQYKFPIVSNGSIRGVKLTRIHLEEDTARSSHDKGDMTLVDYNRAGVPLMELVTEPVIHDAKTAGDFARELQAILRTLGASDANMEKGEMRVEANISVSTDPDKFGTKVEVKNLNSFKSVEDAILYEVNRHIAVIESGGAIVQETRGWDEIKKETFSQRKKENANDYRYFPDPDLPKLYLSKLFDLNSLKAALPELPQAKRDRLIAMNINTELIETLVTNNDLLEYFDRACSSLDQEEKKIASNYLVVDINGLLSANSNAKLPSVENFITLIKMITANELSSRGAKDIIPFMISEDVNPRDYATANNMIQKNDMDSLNKIIDQVISENNTQWQEFKAGNDKLLMFFVGRAMKASNGSGNPKLFTDIIKSK